MESKPSNIDRIRASYRGRMKVAIEDSAKVSGLIRYLAIAGFAIVWMLLSNNFSMLNDNPSLQFSTLMFCLTILFELIHLGISVSVNLYYAKVKLIMYPLYCVSNDDRKMTKIIPTKFPKFWLKTQWVLWYLKLMTLLIGYVLIAYNIFFL